MSERQARLCSAPGCQRAARATGLCMRHYKRRWKGEPVEPTTVKAPVVGGGPCGDVTAIHKALVRVGLGTRRVSIVERALGVRLPSAKDANFDEQARRVFAAIENKRRGLR